MSELNFNSRKASVLHFLLVIINGYMYITTSFLLLMQVSVKDSITKSITIDDLTAAAQQQHQQQLLVANSMQANESEIIIKDESEPHLNVTLIVYSDLDNSLLARGDNERSSSSSISSNVSSGSISSTINTTDASGDATHSTISSAFNASKQLSSKSSPFIDMSSKISISYSQLFETSSGPTNVNDRAEHKWDNEANETIDIAIASSFDAYNNITSASVDKRVKPIDDNQQKESISFPTPLTGIVVNKENYTESWPKLAANGKSVNNTNESYKAINANGFESNANITRSTTTPNNQSEYSPMQSTNQKNMAIEEMSEYSPQQTQHEPLATQTESSGDSPTTTRSLSSIDTTYSTITTTATVVTAKSHSNSSQFITTTSSTLRQPLEQTTQPSMDYIDRDNVSDTTHSSKDDTTNGKLSQLDELSTHTDADVSLLSPSTVTTISLPTMQRELKTETLFNGTTDAVNDDNTTTTDDDDDRDSILPHRRCGAQSLIDINWMRTDAGVLALQACPPPYSGSVYRACYSSGVWGDPDYTDCRLDHLKEIQSLIFYHVHKHLVDGLYPLAEDLSRLVTSGRFPIKSPMDRLDAIDALNAILRAKIRIRMEDEEKNVNLIQALITIKTAEALFGFRLLSENILRALIVSCDDGTIRKIKPIAPNSPNIIMTLTHRTSFGSLIPLVTPSNYTALIKKSQIPQVIIHLEDFNKLGVGISSVWIREIGSMLDNSNFQVISDIILVSVVPAVSIEVDFEETPKVEVELQLKRHVLESDNISCGRIKSPRDLWITSGCETISHNSTSVHCLCDELGIIAALFHKTSSTDSQRNKFGHGSNQLFSVHNFIFYTSLSTSLLLLVITLICQIVQRSRESREASFILINLVSSLSAIQLIFLLVAPMVRFGVANSSPLSQRVCSLVPFVLHYVHLMCAFWMLSHTIFLYQRLWRPVSLVCYREIPLSDSNPSLPSSSKWSLRWQRLHSIAFRQWGCKRFLLFVTAIPAFTVIASYFLNPRGYETKRYCWMSIEGGMLYSFIVPVFLLIMTNTIIMLLVLKRFFENKPLTHKLEIDKTQPALRAGVTLLPFFAVNWFLSVLALEDTFTTAFQCIFSATNLIHCYLVFLFHCYQRYDLHEYVKSRIARRSGKSQKSSLKLKTGHPGRALRVDIPRLCIGDDREIARVPIMSSHRSGDNNNAPDSQPLFKPCSSLSSASQPSITGLSGAFNSKPSEIH